MATAPKSNTSGPFELCPAGGHQLVCCDFVDIGMVQSQYNGEAKMQHKCRIKFQTGLKMKDGKPYLVQRQFTWSMYKSAGLRKFCEQWRGKPFSDQEADDFDFDRLLGINGWATIVHTQTKRGVFADIMSIVPMPPGLPPLVVTDYVRVQDRPKDQQDAEKGQTRQNSAGAPATAQAGAPAGRDPFSDPPPPTDADLARGGFQPAPEVDDDDDLPF
jgi:hypothetical protein